MVALWTSFCEKARQVKAHEKSPISVAALTGQRDPDHQEKALVTLYQAESRKGKEKMKPIRDLTDEQVEQQIAELRESEYEKRGRELAAAGVTLESLYSDKEPEEPENSDW